MPGVPKCELFVAAMGEAAQIRAFEIVHHLQTYSILAECDTCSRSLKAQMKYADKIGARYTLVLGDDELNTGKAKLKNMKTKELTDVDLNGDLAEQFMVITTKEESGLAF